MDIEALKKQFVPRYMMAGEEKYYQYLLECAITELNNNEDKVRAGLAQPEIELLDYYDQFLALYRKEPDEAYMGLARVFRRTAHKIHRILLKRDLTKLNPRFLNLV